MSDASSRPAALPPIAVLDVLPAAEFVAAMAPLFEGAPRFLARLEAGRPFGSETALFARARAIALAMPEAEQVELIDAHPRLGAPPGSVSALSFVEQGYDLESADAAAESELARVAGLFERLNDAYEASFGFRYCVFVAGRPRAALVPGFEAALRADRATEIRRALGDVVAIAEDRLRRLGGRRGTPVIELGSNSYGKSAIRLVKVVRDAERHTVRDLTVEVRLEGDFAAAHTDGDNRLVIATDTMKNTVYALAAEHLDGAIERFGHDLAHHFIGFPQATRATVSIDEHRWVRMTTDAGSAPDAFIRSGDFTRTAVVSATAAGVVTDGGLRDLTVMKTSKSAFAGFPRDRYTTLPDIDDRILATMIDATWRYRADAGALDFDAAFDAIGATLLDSFAEHDSPSVQASIWIVGRAILDRHPEVDEVRMVLPNLHHWPVDLAPFGLRNDGAIFVATREPHGLIDATVRRSDGPGVG